MVMKQVSSQAPVLTVLIDGDCAVCRRSERWCTSRDHRRRLRFRDLHRVGPNELPVAEDELTASVHAVRTDGSIVTGFEAWREILATLDGWGWLARVAGLPGVRQLGRMVYSLVASSRHRFAGGYSGRHSSTGTGGPTVPSDDNGAT